MKFAIWQTYLEDLAVYLAHPNLGRFFDYISYPVTPRDFASNIAKIVKISEDANIPSVREMFLEDRKPNEPMFLDKRFESDYFAVYYLPVYAPFTRLKPTSNTYPENMQNENGIMSALKDKGVEKIILSGSYASQCVLRRAKYLRSGFGLVVPKDSIFDVSRKEYDFALNKLRKLGAKLVKTDDLEDLIQNEETAEFIPAHTPSRP
jgi:nicotinamidase-related amidase